MRSHKVVVDCPECDCDIVVWYDPGCPGRTYGPPEKCYEADPPQIDYPDVCPHCGVSFDGVDEAKWLEVIEPEIDDRDFEREIDREER